MSSLDRNNNCFKIEPADRFDLCSEVFFVSVGDGNNAPYDGEAAIARSIQSLYPEPEFIIHHGDINQEDTPASFINNVVPLWQSSPLFKKMYISFGNHDLDTSEYGSYILDYLEATTNKLGDQKIEDKLYCYDFEIGDLCHFFVINTGNTAAQQNGVTGDPTAKISDQLDEIIPKIKASKALWKIFVCHRPPYSNDDFHNPGFFGYSNSLWQTIKSRLNFKNLGIDLVLSGHGSQYSVFEKDGVYFLQNGSGGATQRNVCTNNPCIPETITNITFREGYVKYNINGERIKWEFIDAFTNEILDSRTIIKSLPSSTWNIQINMSANTSFGIELFGLSPNITIDWGDGTFNTYTTTGVKTRIYRQSGIYTVKIGGFFADNGRIKLNSPVRVISTSVIPTIDGLTSFEQTFENCQSLASIPSNLFANNPSVTTFASCFKDCTALTAIPQNLFENNVLATNFSSTFNNCNKLISIPPNLFQTNVAMTNVFGTFQNCIALTSIPSTLFEKNTLIGSFSQTFRNCTALTSIPSTLFEKNTLVTNFTNTFQLCRNLTSIPPTLFEKNTLATNFTSTFQQCSQLASVPSNLFEKNTLTTRFQNTFSLCSLLKNIPENLFSFNSLTTTFSQVFSSCTGLTGVQQNLFASNPNVQAFDRVFRFCSSLDSIPSGIFRNNQKTTDFSSAFLNTKLNSIPENLFSNNVNVTTFSSCFSSCTGLTSVPSKLFFNNTGVRNFNNTFDNCTGLNSIPSGIFEKNLLADRFQECFKSVTLNTSSYSNLLINLASNSLSRPNNGIFGGGNSRFNCDGQVARSILTGKNWSFSDLGLDPAFAATCGSSSSSSSSSS